MSLVVGTMVGGGVFSLPHDLAEGANSGAVLIGWLVTAMGMIPLAVVYQTLAQKKPELEGGIYTYAREGFGEYMGFNSAWGYWIAGVLGNVASIILLFNALSYFFAVFHNHTYAVIGSSLFLWTLHGLVLMGIKEASVVNIIATIAKLVPILVFITIMTTVFKGETFHVDFWGGGEPIMIQVKNTMLVTLWVFVGVEGAVVLSGRAKQHGDVGKATVWGLLIVMFIYIAISVLSLGAMERQELSKLETPSMGQVLEHVVGPWGASLINIGLIISLLGTLIGWFLLVSEISHVAGKDHVFPRIFEKIDKKHTPYAALWISSGVAQFLFIIILFSNSTYQIMYFIATTSILLPYLFSGLYALKLTFQPNYGTNKVRDRILAICAVTYSFWLVYAAGMQNLLLVSIVYGIGILVYIIARKQQNQYIFTKWERFIMLSILLCAGISAFMLMAGKISM
ncbi:basic amino acid/polyamine antiporter [Ectobacillus sp. JY-23]|nr:basic amino acid/polyamine antiporter [Ectobacillus sp. JY-23]